MPQLTYRWSSITEVPAHASQVPGIRFDGVNPIVKGYPDALEALGIDVRKQWPQLFDRGIILESKLLRQYQNDGAGWVLDTLHQHGGAILADDMGLGKTRTALYSASQLPNVNHILIVTPANVMFQWQDEAKLFGLPSHVMGPPSKGKRYKDAWEQAESGLQSIFITSYQLALKALESFSHPPQCIIFDEPHMFFRGRRGKMVHGLFQHTPTIRYKLACTGTPMFNQPRDLFMLLCLILGGRFGKAKEFDARYCDGKQGTYGWENKGASNLDELRRRLTHYMLRRTTEDVALQLPPLTISFRWVEATEAARAAMMKVTSGGPAVDEALRACLDAKVGDAVETALEMQPCIVFTYYRHHAEEIAAKIEQGGGQAIALHGGITAQVRHNLVKQCAANKTSIVATIDSMGTGTNLQGITSDMVFHTIERSPKKTHQAIKRAHRSGQDKPGRAVFIAMRDAMDEIVAEAVVKRLSHWEQVMGRDTMNNDLEPALVTDTQTEDEILKAIYAEMQA